MRITETRLQTQAEAYSYASTRHETKLEARIQSLPRNTANTASAPSTLVNITAQASQSPVKAKGAEDQEFDPKLTLLLTLLERLSGRKIKLFHAEELHQQAQPVVSLQQTGETASPERSPAPSLEWSVRFETKTIHEEAEGASYRAQGQVKTADGRTIDFALGLDMKYYARTESSTLFEAGNVPRKDPLVLNLNTDQVRLTGSSVSFDLDIDGQNDKLAVLASGSAYLVLDRNGNGQIDDGTELFGARSGDGFEELSSLDSDGNGWIDEGDAEFSELQVWRPGETAASIAEVGVGAISLAREATPYTLRANGEESGNIRTTGLFLTEAGEAKTVQQIDLVA